MSSSLRTLKSSLAKDLDARKIISVYMPPATPAWIKLDSILEAARIHPLAGVLGKGWQSRKLGTGSNRSHYPQGEQMGSLDQGDGLREGHTKSGLEVRGLCIREWLEAKRYKQGQESGEHRPKQHAM